MSDFAPLVALMRGFSYEEVAALQIAISNFDGSYNSLRTHLKSLEPTDNVWRVVNTAIIDTTGKHRYEVSRYDLTELEAWTEGYRLTQASISAETLNQATLITVRAFSQALANMQSEDEDNDF